MESQIVQNETYKVEYDSTSATATFQGCLRLGGPKEYAPIADLLDNAIAQEPPTITLNLKKLEFLNSSGISVLSKFVIHARKKNTTKILIQGSEEIPWQGKSLKNLQRLMPSLKLELS